MRFCADCTDNNVPYVISRFSNLYKRYYRFIRFCDLNFFSAEITKIFRITEKLDEQIFNLAAKKIRLRKQRRLLLKKNYNLGDREA